jgi:hypothetical protein
MSNTKHIEAILTIAEREFDSEERRAGILSALLEESIPYLKRQLQAEKTLDFVRQQLAEAESNATERSDPASNEDLDDLIRTLRTLISTLEVKS